MDRRLQHLSALRYFESAARHKSYSKAASELHVSQAAVSQKLRKLESELNSKLFSRDGRDMILTNDGRALYDKVSPAFDMILEGLNSIQDDRLSGVLTVMAPPSFASRWLMSRLWKFSHEFPETLIRVTSHRGPGADLLRSADVVIGEIFLDKSDSTTSKTVLFDEPVFPVCSPALGERWDLSNPAELAKCWLIRGINSRRFSWQSWFQKAGVEVDEKRFQWMEVDTFDMGLSAVLAGHGVCPATDSLAGDLIDRGLLIKPFDISLSPGIEYSAIYQRDSIRKERIAVFIEWLKKEADLYRNKDMK